jgi:hypothetical protein
MNTCPITTLKTHSLGDKYTPTLKANGRYQLVNSSGQVLIGIRGNEYNFQSYDNAMTWLNTNLARWKNHTDLTPVNHIVKLHKVYAKTQAQYVLNELQAINEYELGQWEVVLNVEAGAIDWELLDVDGGDSLG